MKSHLRIVVFLFLLAGTLGDDGFNLFDALNDPEPTPVKPTEKPKAPEKPKNDDGLDLLDAFGPDEPAPTVKPNNPSSDDTGGFGFNLEDALGPDSNPKPDKPAVNQPNSGGGHAGESDYDPNGGADQPQEAGSGQIAGIVSAVGVALAGAAGSYFAYQKKKLCFKLQGGADPESGKGQHGTNSEPQVLSNLLRTN